MSEDRKGLDMLEATIDRVAQEVRLAALPGEHRGARRDATQDVSTSLEVTSRRS